MANIKVSELPTATSANNEDYFMIVQNNESKKITVENLNNNFNLLSNQIYLIGNDMNLTTTVEQQTEVINLNTVVASVGNKLTFDSANNAVVIGSGVNYVSVSCGCAIILSSSGMTYQALFIRKNGSSTNIGNWAQSKGQYSPSTYSYTTLSDILIPVQEGDKISIALFNRAKGTLTIGKIYMSVKVIG